jgi:hypothetical protein
MSAPDTTAPGAAGRNRTPAIRRLLVVADAAIADVAELPPRVRAMIDEAGEIYVVTPSLPGRLDWVASELNPSRHIADERLHTVLGQLRSIGAEARGTTGDDSTLTAFADAVAQFQPDHILIGLRSPDHANWQERRLVKHVQKRFALPVTSFAIDPRGQVSAT